MYVGRILAVGKTDTPFVAYRVSSRSAPNRVCHLENNTASVRLKPGVESNSPYTSYNCIRLAGDTTVVGNGTHTDTIIDLLNAGKDPETAISQALKKMGYEKDDFNTPRIAGAIQGGIGYIGTIRKDGLEVDSFQLESGYARIIATYELDKLTTKNYEFTGSTPSELARHIYDGAFFATLEKPICSCAWQKNYAVYNPIIVQQARKLLHEMITDQKVLDHSEAVRHKALSVLKDLSTHSPSQPPAQAAQNADKSLIEIGSLLHDIGRSKSHGITHALLGVEIAEQRDLSTEIVDIIRNHIGAGLDPDQSKQLGLPQVDFNPKTIEQKIVCYADLLVFGDQILPYSEAIKKYEEKHGPTSAYVSKIKKLHNSLYEAHSL